MATLRIGTRIGIPMRTGLLIALQVTEPGGTEPRVIGQSAKISQTKPQPVRKQAIRRTVNEPTLGLTMTDQAWPAPIQIGKTARPVSSSHL